nr:uncharacterized protein LOC127294903 [Lolium perenne]
MAVHLFCREQSEMSGTRAGDGRPHQHQGQGTGLRQLGDLVISVETSWRQAEERGPTLLDEMRILMIGGPTKWRHCNVLQNPGCSSCYSASSCSASSTRTMARDGSGS